MKNKIKKITLILCIGILMTTIIYANQSEAGSSSDPLVTKSYVDEKISEMLKLINENISKPNDNTNDDENSPLDKPVDENNTQDKDEPASFSYKPVSVEVGQSIYGDEGTELILRSGKGQAIVPTAEGISNITKGVDMKNGEAIQKNNMLIIPRKDGRGIKVTEKAWFLVRGSYEIK